MAATIIGSLLRPPNRRRERGRCGEQPISVTAHPRCTGGRRQQRPPRTGVYQSERAPIRRARTLVPPRTEDDLARPNAARHRRSGRLAGCSRQAAPAAPAHRIGDFDPAIRGAPVTNSPCRRSSRRSPSTCSCTASPPPGNAPVLGDSGPAAPAAGAVLLFCVQPKTKEPEDEEFHEHTVGAPVLGTDVALPRIVALTATPPRAGPHAGYYLTS